MSRSTLPAILAAFTAVVMLFACKGKPHDPANLTAIDSMLVQVDSLERQVNAIEIPVYLQMDSAFRIQKDRLEVLMKDTLDRSQAIAAGNYYRAMNGSLGRVRKLYDATREELQLMRKQLTDLKKDVADGHLPPGPETTYVQQERLYLSALAQKTVILLNSAGTAKRAWDEHGPRVDSLLAMPSSFP
jgi:hypothetical protein